MPAPERIPTGSLTDTRLITLLTEGQLTVRGQIRDASNAVLYCTVAYEGEERTCVYKPVAGEQPLWDFPDGTLAGREVAAYEISEVTGWGLVPPTVLRDGPYGEGMCQLWIEAPSEASADGEPPLLALVEDEEAGGRVESRRPGRGGRGEDGAAGARGRSAAAAAGGPRRGDQQRRPEGRAPAAGCRTAGCTGSTTE